MNSKIVLGTVQFGLKYGINHLSRPTFDEIEKILDASHALGICEIDTAGAYGNALELLSEYQKRNGSKFKIVTKVVLESGSFIEQLRKDLQRLSLSNLEGCYIHRFEDLNHPTLFREVTQAKQKNLIKQFGVSLYSADQLRSVYDNPAVDIIQIPFNLFDQDETKKRLLLEARQNGKTIYARSVFLQGLLFMSPSKLPAKLANLSTPLAELQALSSQNQMNLAELCLKYVLDENCIDKVILGVESQIQLEANLKAHKLDIPPALRNRLQALDVSDKTLINPLFWK